MLRAAEDWLAARGVAEPRRSAELLLAHALGLTRLDLYLHHDRPLGEPERAAMRALMIRRGRGEPVAHVLGEWDFRGLTLAVSPEVLIPRPETEDLVDLALEHAAPGARCVDLGTGSGAIAIALAVERPDLQPWAVDVSDAALEIARANAERHGVGDRVHFARGSWWEPLAGEVFDLVVANPPYVDPNRPELVDAEVQAHEPAMALFASPDDPISAYRALVPGLQAGLAAGGWIVLETGVGVAEPALELLRAQSFLTGAALRPDLAGHPRYLLAQRR